MSRVTLTRFGGVRECGHSPHLLLINNRTDVSQRGMQASSVVKAMPCRKLCKEKPIRQSGSLSGMSFYNFRHGIAFCPHYLFSSCLFICSLSINCFFADSRFLSTSCVTQ